MIPRLYRIARREEEYPGTFTLQLSAEPGSGASPFQPGQFNMLYAFGAGEVPISMSGPVSPDRGYVHTIRTLGLVTQSLERLREGEPLGLRGPFGSGWPLEKAAGKELLVIAGGLGLAPLRPVIYRLLESKQRTGGIRLFYGARRPGEMLYRQELRQWAQSAELVLSVDHADSGWTGHIGVITDPLSAERIDAEKTLAFVCGPEIMMRFCIRVLLKKGVPESAIYLSMERNMKCATGHCGHCQWGPNFICKDGPVFCYRDIRQWFDIRAL